MSHFSNKEQEIAKPNLFLLVAVYSFFLLTCSFHFLNSIGINAELGIVIIAVIISVYFAKHSGMDIIKSLKKPTNNIIFKLIVFFSFAGVLIEYQNTIHIAHFIFLFLFVTYVWSNLDLKLEQITINAIIYSGIFMSLGLLIGLLELIFLNTQLFHGYSQNYPYFEGRTVLSGFGFNHNYSAYIIIIALSFLSLNKANWSATTNKILTILFFIAIILTGSRIAILFSSLYMFNYLISNSYIRNSLSVLLVLGYVFFTHIIILPHDGYDPGTRFWEILFTNGIYDLVIGNYGYSKIAYFVELKNNFFLPINVSTLATKLDTETHFLITNLISLGGVPLLITCLVYVYRALIRNIVANKNSLEILYYCGLISIITETIFWDASNSLFFWLFILFVNSNKKELA